MGRQRASKGIFEGEIPDKSRPLLLLVAGAAENGKDWHVEWMPDEMGGSIPAETGRPWSDNHLTWRKDDTLHNRNEEYEQSASYHQCTDMRAGHNSCVRDRSR